MKEYFLKNTLKHKFMFLLHKANSLDKLRFMYTISDLFVILSCYVNKCDVTTDIFMTNPLKMHQEEEEEKIISSGSNARK